MEVLTRIGAAITFAVLVVGALLWFDVLDVNWPWEGVATSTTSVSYDRDRPEPKIVEIEPIALDCRARIHAEVPVKAVREHQLAGKTYSTDTVEMTAIGDVDTCVDSSSVEIAERSDGSFDVIVPADSIEFVRPRVDAAATMDSVLVDRGLLSEFIGLFPGVSDNDGLTPAAYAFAQGVIGGSDCMRQAFDLTAETLERAYRNQMSSQGEDPDDIEVIISGIPDFTQNDFPQDSRFDDFDFSVDDQESVCTVSAGATAVEGDVST